MKCALFYYVNSYKFKVSKGTLTITNEQINDTKHMADSWDLIESSLQLLGTASVDVPLDESTLKSIAFNKISSAANRTDLMLISPASRSRFNISKPAINSISNHFQSTFASQLRELNISNSNISNSKEGRLTGFTLHSFNSQIQYNPSIMQALFASHDLSATFTTLAASISNTIQTKSDEIFNRVPNVITGSKGKVTTFYQIAWP